MRAAAYAVGRIDRPPYELQMAGYVERYGDPWRLGWLEWPAGLLPRMQTTKAYADALRNYRRFGGQPGFINNNTGIFELTTQVWNWAKAAGVDWRLFT